MPTLNLRLRIGLATLAATATVAAPAVVAPAPAFATPQDTLCTGTWIPGGNANVIFRRSADGRLDWRYLLTNKSKLFLGPTVAVSMPFAYLNGRPINPPYQEHVEANSYDFHSSVRNVQFTGAGGGSRPIATGDVLTMYWFMYGMANGNAADAYVICEIPPPGSG